MIPLPEPDGVMGAVWALVRSAPNFDGRDRDVVAAARAYATRYADAVRAEERERAAQICTTAMPQPVTNWCDAQIVEALRQCAEAIRNYRAQDNDKAHRPP